MARNVGARLVALVGLALATVVLGRIGGPEAVGLYVLLRVVPSLCAVVVACGLPAALPYFLSGPDRENPALRPTLLWLLAAGSAAALGVWLLVVPLVGPLLFRGVPSAVLVVAGIACATQLWLAAGRSWLQGTGDLKGGDAVLASEEVAFLPAYALLAAAPLGFGMQVVVALVVAHAGVAAYAWRRLARSGALRGVRGRPDFLLARCVLWYGARGQTSALLNVLNLRLDVALLGALAGPAVVGTYAVASKYAELLRLPGLAATYVLYPAFSEQHPAVGARRVPRLAGRAALLSAAAALPLLLAAPYVLNGVYGREFRSAVLPALILIGGLLLDAAAGVVVAWLYGAGRPGLTSVAAGCGVAVTVVLDLLLIPRMGAVGAALASSAAYVLTALVLWRCFRRAATSAARAASMPDAALLATAS